MQLFIWLYKIKYCKSSREFSHRVNSISMARFTPDDIKKLQEGGNEVRIRS